MRFQAGTGPLSAYPHPLSQNWGGDLAASQLRTGAEHHRKSNNSVLACAGREHARQAKSLTLSYHPTFLIRSTASANLSFVVHTVIRIYPSPGAPNPFPGVVTIPALSNRCAVNVADL